MKLTQQEIFKKLYDNKEDILAARRIFPIRKARTCRNCYFYGGDDIDYCPFPQKPNPNYNFKDFNNNQNRYKFIPNGYCVPVRYHINGWEDDPGYYVHLAINKILDIYK